MFTGKDSSNVAARMRQVVGDTAEQRSRDRHRRDHRNPFNREPQEIFRSAANAAARFGWNSGLPAHRCPASKTPGSTGHDVGTVFTVPLINFPLFEPGLAALRDL
jgi:hypothetical protein